MEYERQDPNSTGLQMPDVRPIKTQAIGLLNRIDKAAVAAAGMAARSGGPRPADGTCTPPSAKVNLEPNWFHPINLLPVYRDTPVSEQINWVLLLSYPVLDDAMALRRRGDSLLLAVADMAAVCGVSCLVRTDTDPTILPN
ncbi:hypothetical protein J6590_081809 [Homalodisca vitripennis]|nr:hypothetical protein J6590_081809 [Homalodisca vitripennis]